MQISSRTYFTLLTLMLLLAGSFARGADPEFVGVLALAVDEANAKALSLTDEQKAQLLKVIQEREDKVVNLALEIKDLPPAEREAKLAPFRQESEKAGLAILDEKQRATLEQLRLRKYGMVTLGDPKMAEALGLSDDQKEQIAKQLATRLTNLSKTAAKDVDRVNAYYEKRLVEMLTPEQRAMWEEMAGGAPAGGAVAASQATQEGGQPASGGTGSTAAVREPPRPDGKMRFQFRYTPWDKVIDWFAQMADYSLVIPETVPQGTFNYTDSKYYTPSEALDLLNSVLLTKGFCLVRKERMLFVVDQQDTIPDEFVEDVSLQEIDNRGKYELVRVLFHVTKAAPDEVAVEIEKLRSPHGSVVVIPKARMLRVTDIAGRLRIIRSVIEAIENPEGVGPIALRVFELKNAFAAEVLPVVRPLLGIPADAYVATDDSIRIAVDPSTGKLMATGKPEKTQLLEEILRGIDVPLPNTPGGPGIETPQLIVHRLAGADSASVLAILQTIFANSPDVRLTIDPKTLHLVALARPSQHATIRELIREMQSEGRRAETIKLRRVDPQSAVLLINKLYPPSETSARIDADPTTRTLFIVGTDAQIESIKALIDKMEGGPEALAIGGGELPMNGNVRMVPLSSRQLQQIMESVQQIWASQGGIPVRVVPPSTNIPSMRINEPLPVRTPGAENGNGTDLKPQSRPATPSTQPATPARPPATPAPVRDASRRIPGTRIMFVSQVKAAEQEGPSQEKAAPAQEPTDKPAEEPPYEGPEIVVVPGPRGLMLFSEDTEALNKFESLLGMLVAQLPKQQYYVYYLTNASALSVAETLSEILAGGGGAASAPDAGGGLLGNIVQGALGPAGNLLGGLLGGGGGSSGPSTVVHSGTLSIVPEPRLNALIVQGTSNDLDAVENLLRILDQGELPETQVSPKPRMIYVTNTSAAQIAEVVRDVYQERLVGSRSQQRQPSPEEFFQMLRGGGDRGRGSSSSRRNDPSQQKMSIGVDERVNALIVAAPQALFEEVKQMVETLDHATGADANNVVRVVSLKRNNGASVQKAIAAIAGDRVSTSSDRSSRSFGSGGDSGRSSSSDDEMRRRIEFFNRMQGGGSPFGGSPFGGGGPSFGGFSGRSSFGGGDSGRSFGGDSGRSFGGDRGGFGGDRGGFGGFGGDRGGDRGGSSRSGR
jgi:type II secretory pathway component GspD/PulD (secretin)